MAMGRFYQYIKNSIAKNSQKIEQKKYGCLELDYDRNLTKFISARNEIGEKKTFYNLFQSILRALECGPTLVLSLFNCAMT